MADKLSKTQFKEKYIKDKAEKKKRATAEIEDFCIKRCIATKKRRRLRN